MDTSGGVRFLRQAAACVHWIYESIAVAIAITLLVTTVSGIVPGTVDEINQKEQDMTTKSLYILQAGETLSRLKTEKCGNRRPADPTIQVLSGNICPMDTSGVDFWRQAAACVHWIYESIAVAIAITLIDHDILAAHNRGRYEW